MQFVHTTIHVGKDIFKMWPMNSLHECVVNFVVFQRLYSNFYIYDELKLIVWSEYWNNYNCIFGERFMVFIVFHITSL